MCVTMFKYTVDVWVAAARGASFNTQARLCALLVSHLTPCGHANIFLLLCAVKCLNFEDIVTHAVMERR